MSKGWCSIIKPCVKKIGKEIIKIKVMKYNLPFFILFFKKMERIKKNKQLEIIEMLLPIIKLYPNILYKIAKVQTRKGG